MLSSHGAIAMNKIPDEFAQWVRRWSLTDPRPGPEDSKQALRDEIQAQTEEYLSKGGEIHQVTKEEGFYYNHPIKLSRKAQIRYNKKFLKTSHGKKTD